MAAAAAAGADALEGGGGASEVPAPAAPQAAVPPAKRSRRDLRLPQLPQQQAGSGPSRSDTSQQHSGAPAFAAATRALATCAPLPVCAAAPAPEQQASAPMALAAPTFQGFFLAARPLQQGRPGYPLPAPAAAAAHTPLPPPAAARLWSPGTFLADPLSAAAHTPAASDAGSPIPGLPFVSSAATRGAGAAAEYAGALLVDQLGAGRQQQGQRPPPLWPHPPAGGDQGLPGPVQDGAADGRQEGSSGGGAAAAGAAGAAPAQLGALYLNIAAELELEAAARQRRLALERQLLQGLRGVLAQVAGAAGGGGGGGVGGDGGGGSGGGGQQ
jgi:hypothetical protein